jgi:4-amino-4-deoxy-L-arabinose transferase-like glycosyltransferase
MKRVFLSPLTALSTGICLRLLFVLKLPAGAGDTVIYEQLATNWLKHGKYAMDIGGALVPVDLRVPGYPAFLALVCALTGRTGEHARIFVMLAQVVVDLATCLAIGTLAALLVTLGDPHAKPKRAFTAGLWLAALCPFAANYVAVPLTETWAIFLTAVAMIILVLLATLSRDEGGELFHGNGSTGKGYWTLAALAGLVVGVGTLFRPETPLLLVTTLAVMGFWMARRGEWKRWWLTGLLMGCTCCVPLVPWAIRNAVTLHEFQPLAPKDATLPGEIDPKGFMAWERTWLYRVRDCYLVPWKLNDESIHLDDIPAEAFDTPEEKERVAAVLEQYNDDLTLTEDEDAVFAQLARERTARHPLRTYLWIPLRRVVRMWFTPRIELVPVSGNVFPVTQMWDEDPVDQGVTVLFFLLNIFCLALATWGVWKLWKWPGVRVALTVLLFYILARTVFLTTVETPEPRYVLECFPALLAFGALVFALSGNKEKPA